MELFFSEGGQGIRQERGAQNCSKEQRGRDRVIKFTGNAGGHSFVSLEQFGS
jgi:hypothetical protein